MSRKFLRGDGSERWEGPWVDNVQVRTQPRYTDDDVAAAYAVANRLLDAGNRDAAREAQVKAAQLEKIKAAQDELDAEAAKARERLPVGDLRELYAHDVIGLDELEHDVTESLRRRQEQ